MRTPYTRPAAKGVSALTRGTFGALLGCLLMLGAAAVTKAPTESSGYTCTLTGKHVELCCCTPWPNGRLYCTLAKKEIDSCCCKVDDKKPEKGPKPRAPEEPRGFSP